MEFRGCNPAKRHAGKRSKYAFRHATDMEVDALIVRTARTRAHRLNTQAGPLENFPDVHRPVIPHEFREFRTSPHCLSVRAALRAPLPATRVCSGPSVLGLYAQARTRSTSSHGLRTLLWVPVEVVEQMGAGV